MKKWMAALMAALMLGTVGAAAQETQTQAQPQQVTAVAAPNYGDRTAQEAYEELIVGVTTKPAGDFFSDMWGNNTTDIDVRGLLHGYNLMAWQSALGTYAINPTVVSGIVVTQDEAGNRTYTVALTQDLIYNNGQPITAADYAFSILLSAAPQMREIGATTGKTDYILGSQAYSLGESGGISGVRLISDSQFSVTVQAEYLPFFYEMGLLDFCPYPISVIAPGCEVADDGQGVMIRNIDQTVLEPLFTAQLLQGTLLDRENGYRSHPAVTSGPYALTGYDAEAGSATFALNPNFKGDENGQQPTIERLTLKTVDNETMLEQLASGQVDLLHKVVAADTVSQGLALSAQGGARSSNYLRSGLTLLSFNCEQGPSQFEKVRQAVALCFDRDAFIQAYVGAYGMAVNGYYGMGQWMVQLVNGTSTAPVQEPAEGAAQEEMDAYQQALDAWSQLSLDGLNAYALDLEAARQLLTEDGWTLNEAGDPFTQGVDAVRCKMVDGEIMKLNLTLVVPQGNAAAVLLHDLLAENLAQVGGQMSIEEMPFDQLLSRYYRQQARDNDLFYLGTNFAAVYDPAGTYSPLEESQGALNTTGLRDQTLYELAVNMRATEPGDVLGYCQKWLAFETYWNQVLPAVPVYSNVYFDFYVDRLQNYQIAVHEAWPQAILYAYLSDAVETDEPADEEAADGDGLITID